MRMSKKDFNAEIIVQIV
jgi:hypothetical protein